MAANATDNFAVASVQFYVDGQPLGAPVTASPYAVTWATTTTVNGTHSITAKATDPSGNVGTSAAVGVTVQNPAPPMTCFVQQAVVSAYGNGSQTTPAFSTVAPREVFLAFASLDGPNTANGQSATVSGAGLTGSSWAGRIPNTATLRCGQPPLPANSRTSRSNPCPRRAATPRPHCRGL